MDLLRDINVNFSLLNLTKGHRFSILWIAHVKTYAKDPVRWTVGVQKDYLIPHI